MTNTQHARATGTVSSRSTYAAPFRVDEFPRNRAAWRALTGLSDPAVVAAQVALRTEDVPADPTYDDFFHTS